MKNIIRPNIITLLILCFLMFIGCDNNKRVNNLVVVDKDRAAYEYGELVSLSGTVIAEEISTFQDYPGDSKPMIKTRIPVLKLEKGIDVAVGDTPESDVKEIQLAFSSWDIAKQYIDKKVIVSGELYHQMTAHHHKKVLIFVKKIEEQK